MYRELSFDFKVLIPEPIDNGIVDPWFFQKVGGLATASRAGLSFDSVKFEAIEKILPGDDGMIDGVPSDFFDGGLMGF